MTIVVGRSPIRNDRASSSSLATTLAPRSAPSLHVVVRVPSPLADTRVRRHRRGVRRVVARAGRRAVAEATGAVRLLGGGRLRGRRRPRPSAAAVLEEQAEEIGAGMIVVGSADHGEPGQGVMARRPTGCCTPARSRSRSRAPGLSLTGRWRACSPSHVRPLPGRRRLPLRADPHGGGDLRGGRREAAGRDVRGAQGATSSSAE